MSNGIYIAIGAVLVVAGILVALLLRGMRGRGRLIECQSAELNSNGQPSPRRQLGFTCPKCKYRANASSFRYVNERESNPSEK